MRVVRAQAPSNIALIKYMGKKDTGANLPENPSLSMTLSGLRTEVKLKSDFLGRPLDLEWVTEAGSPQLDEKEIDRLKQHLDRVRASALESFPAMGLSFQDQDTFELSSANTFPSSSGIASSASSFAALTLASAACFSRDLKAFLLACENDSHLKRWLSKLARQGSGSSCRSFDGPWVFWESEFGVGVSSTLPEMTDFVILVDSAKKEVSSSRAHSRVKTSPHWEGRVQRARERSLRVREALLQGDIRSVARIAWEDSWEMHHLFHTAAEPFTYWKPLSSQILHTLKPHVFTDSLLKPLVPIVTMDAGPNVHVLVPTHDAPEWRDRFDRWFKGVPLLEDQQGQGASILEALDEL